jgi:hypothetical protein
MSMSESYLKELQLPSKGKLYDGQIPDGLVSIEPLGTREEKLYSSGESNGLAILDKIFDACLSCPMDHQKLILGDRLFIFLQLRSITYGKDYDFSFRCESCRKKSFMSIDLDKLPVKFARDVEDPLRFEVPLPLMKDKLVLRLLTGEDEQKIRQYAKQVIAKTKGLAADTEYIYRLARRLETVNGQTLGIREAMEYIEQLKGRDSLAIRDAVADFDVGPDIGVSPTCKLCGYDNDEIMLPLGSEFFRPRRRSPNARDDLAAAEHVDAAANRVVE